MSELRRQLVTILPYRYLLDSYFLYCTLLLTSQTASYSRLPIISLIIPTIPPQTVCSPKPCSLTP